MGHVSLYPVLGIAAVLVVQLPACTAEGRMVLFDNACMEITTGGLSASAATSGGAITFAASSVQACLKTDENGQTGDDCPAISSASATTYNDANNNDEVDPGESKSNTSGPGAGSCVSLGVVEGTFQTAAPYNPKYIIEVTLDDGTIFKQSGSLDQ